MPATIIDALVVTLGLDGGPYKRAAREAAREQAKLKDSVKKGGDEVSSALAEVGRQAALLFIGFEGIKGAINFFAGINVATADLGRFSKNLGESAHEVNTWDSAVELAGGSAKDAQADLQGLSNSITALKATGDVSPLLLLFQRMGVSIYDAQGKTRKLTDLYKDLGDKLRQYNRADAFNLARQAGLSESTFNLIRAEGDERERLLRLAEQNNTVTDESTQKAAELQEEWRGIGQTVKGFGLTLLGDITPAIKDLFGWVQRIFTGVKNTGFLQGVFTVLAGAVRVLVDLVRVAWSGLSQLFDLLVNSKAGKFLVGLLEKLKGFGKEFVAQADRFADQYAPEAKTAAPAPAAALTAAQRKAARNNPGDLRFAGQSGATNEGGFASFKTLADGIQASNRQLDLFAKRGINTIDKIISKWAPPNENNTPAYKAALSKFIGKGLNEELTTADRQRLLQGIFNQEGVNKVSSAQIAGVVQNPNALSAAQFANSQAVPGQTGGAGGNTSTTTIDIGEVHVHAPNARDANDIAAELPGALKRKGIVAQADSGMS
jgi:hypothetical protein